MRPSLQFVGELLGGTLSKKHLFVIARIVFSIYGLAVGHLRNPRAFRFRHAHPRMARPATIDEDQSGDQVVKRHGASLIVGFSCGRQRTFSFVEDAARERAHAADPRVTWTPITEKSAAAGQGNVIGSGVTTDAG